MNHQGCMYLTVIVADGFKDVSFMQSCTNYTPPLYVLFRSNPLQSRILLLVEMRCQCGMCSFHLCRSWASLCHHRKQNTSLT